MKRGTRRGAVIGSAGVLGQEMLHACRSDGFSSVTAVASAALETRELNSQLSALRPDVIFYISEEADSQETIELIAARAAAMGAIVVFFSSNQVFPGEERRPFDINDTPAPTSALGRRAWEHERALRESGCQYLIIRSGQIFSPEDHQLWRDLLSALASRKAIAVPPCAVQPTCPIDLARMTLQLLDRGVRGVIHAANSGSCSWQEFAGVLREEFAFSCEIRAGVSSNGEQVHLPQEALLSISALIDSIGFPPHWRDMIARRARQMASDAFQDPDFDLRAA